MDPVRGSPEGSYFNYETFKELPYEVAIEILSKLSSQELIALSQASKHFRYLVGDSKLLGDRLASEAFLKHISSSDDMWSFLRPTKLALPKGTLITDKMIIEIVAKGSSLVELDLSGTIMNPKQLEKLSEITGLQTLKLGSCNLTEEHLHKLAQFPKLAVLDVNNCHLGTKSAECLASITGLHTLDVSWNPLWNAGLHLAKLTGLRSLNIECTDLNDEDVGHLKKLTKLDRLIANPNRFSREARAQVTEWFKGSHLYI